MPAKTTGDLIERATAQPGRINLSSTGIGTPRPIVNLLNREIRQVLQAADVKQDFDKLGIEVEISTPEELLAYNRVQIDKWGKAIEAAGITPE